MEALVLYAKMINVRKYIVVVVIIIIIIIIIIIFIEPQWGTPLTTRVELQ